MRKLITAIARKEWKDAIRDRRSLISAAIYSALGPLVIFLMLNALAVEENDETAIRLAVIGETDALVLTKLIASDDLAVFPVTPTSPEHLLSDYDAVLVIKASFSDSLRQRQPATIELFVDRATDVGARAVTRLQQALKAYQARHIEARLMARGVNPDITRPLSLQIRDMAEDQPATIAITRLLVLFLVMAPFFGSLNAAADMTAGEREREALQPLLTQPVPLWMIVIGKWLVATSIGVIAASATMIVAAIAINSAPTTEIGVLLYATPRAQLIMILLLIPLAGLVSALQMMIGIRSKSYKEAQTYLSLFSFLPVVIGFAAVFKQQYIPEVTYAPIAHHLGLLQRALLDQPIDITLALGGAGFSLFAALLCLAICIRTYKSEKILSGT
tara:strand:- start:7122 stop:8285 length:1164 start_codon:yes stop_codon:yes gene_type:complete